MMEPNFHFYRVYYHQNSVMDDFCSTYREFDSFEGALLFAKHRLEDGFKDIRVVDYCEYIIEEDKT